MTGEKDRYATQEKLWKLNDETLTTPKHDEMVLWLLNKENVRKILPSVDVFLKEQTENNVTHDIIIKSESPISTNNQFIIGYWDIVIIRKRSVIISKDQIITKRIGARIYMEVKPYIDSFGKTLRQIKTYVNYLPKEDHEGNPIQNEVYLFTADLKFKDAFESQDIKVLSYNP